MHGSLVGLSAITALAAAGILLATNPRSPAVRAHGIYGATVAWWLAAMALSATAESSGRAQVWARLAQIGICMLPAVVYHVNIALTGLLATRRLAVRVHYGLAGLVTVFGLTFPGLLAEPQLFSWGYYPAYTAWGAIPLAFLLVTFVEVSLAHREVIRKTPPESPYYRSLSALYYGNFVTFLAAVDFLPAFGLQIYPFGFALMGAMFVATVTGSLRYQLIAITPEIAAEQILETMPTGVLVADTQGLVRLANASAARVLGRPLAELLNQPLDAIANDSSLRRALDSVTSGMPATSSEVRFSAADGTIRSVAVSGAAVAASTGRPAARLWLLQDLTEQRHAEAERQRLEGWVRQTQKMESLGVMAGGIAHDFNNILTAIMGSAEIAATRSADGLPVQQEMQTILSSAEHAAELTGQLLTYAGRDTLVEAPIDLNALVLGMSDLLHSVSRTAKLELSLSPRRPMILGDTGQLRQVILNLITNASEAIGAAPGTITLRTRDDDSGPQRRAVLEVTDTGIGMDAEAQTRVFEPFFSTKFQGRGLGLAIVIRIVQAHHGVVNVHSTPGAGTCFEVSLPPLARDHPLPAAAPGAPIEPASGGLVLLADDETSVRGVVRMALGKFGYTVIEAADGVAAVEAFRQQPSTFVAVVMDVTMPGMDGVEAVRQIRLTAPRVPVVFISGYTATEGPAALSDSRTAFLPKPFKMPVLATTLRDVIAGTAAPPTA